MVLFIGSSASLVSTLQRKASNMAESLRRLANIGSFSTLQDKLDRWLDVYHVSTVHKVIIYLSVYILMLYWYAYDNKGAVSMQAHANTMVARENPFLILIHITSINDW